MLLSDAQVALNEAIVTLKDAATCYQGAADATSDFGLATLFQAIGRQRRRMAEELEAHIRQTGVLPREPDTDRETITNLVTRLKAMLRQNELVTLLRERERAEQELALRIEEALNEDLPAAALSILRQFHADVIATRQHLAALAERIAQD